MITLETIIAHVGMDQKMATILESLGMDILKDGIKYSHKPEHMNPVITDEDSMKEYLWSITKASIRHYHRFKEHTKANLLLHIDLYGHSGLPDGETDKYLGHIELRIEETAFILLAAKYL